MEMVQHGFLEQKEKFNNKFKVLEVRIDALEENIETQIDKLRGELHGIKDQVGIIDCRAEVETLKIRVDRIEKHLKEA